MPEVKRVQLVGDQKKTSRRELKRRMEWLSSINQRLGAVSQMVLKDINNVHELATEGLLEAERTYGERRGRRLWVPGQKQKDEAKTLAAVSIALIKVLVKIKELSGKYPTETLTQGIVRMIQTEGVAKVTGMDLMTHYKTDTLPPAEAQFRAWLDEHGMQVSGMTPDPVGGVRYDIRLVEDAGAKPKVTEQAGVRTL